MQDRPVAARNPDPDTPSNQTAETPLESIGEVVVEHHDTPPPGPADKRIHPRRSVPLVPTAPTQPNEKDEKDV